MSLPFPTNEAEAAFTAKLEREFPYNPEDLNQLRERAAKEDREISQVLGKALGYPWYKDDQKNFPGATEADGVCVGEHVTATLAQEAATRLRNLEDMFSSLIDNDEDLDDWVETLQEKGQYVLAEWLVKMNSIYRGAR